MPRPPKRAIEPACPPVNGWTPGGVVVGLGVPAADVPLTVTPGLVAVDETTGGVLAAVVVEVPETLTPGLVAVVVGGTLTVVGGTLTVVGGTLTVVGGTDVDVLSLGETEVDVVSLGETEVDVVSVGCVEVVSVGVWLSVGTTHGILSTYHGRTSRPAM